MRDRLIEAGYNENKLEIVPTFSKPLNIKHLNVQKEEGQYILYFGRVTKIKGIKLLLESYKLFSNKYSNCKLKIIGSCNEKEKNELFRNTDLNNVILEGNLDTDSLIKQIIHVLIFMILWNCI